jgi:hypothetical protein
MLPEQYMRPAKYVEPYMTPFIHQRDHIGGDFAFG